MKSIDKDLERLDALIKEYYSYVFGPILRYKPPSVHGWDRKKNEVPNRFMLSITGEKIFDDSIYEVKFDSSFIHFTSIHSLFSILRNGYFRMSELGDFDDKNELLYASQMFHDNPNFNFDETAIHKVRSQLFVFSALTKTRENIIDSFMWHSYGDKASGAYIEFEIDAHKAGSKLFAIGKVLYGKKNIAIIEELKNRVINFQSKHGVIHQNFIEVITLLLSFHKAAKYQDEQEIRILHFTNQSSFYSDAVKNIYSDINKRGEVKRFSKLLLSGSNNDNSTPLLEIKRIVLGYNIELEQKLKLTELLFEEKKKRDFELWTLDHDLVLSQIF